MKVKHITSLAAVVIALAAILSWSLGSAEAGSGAVGKDCTFKGKKLYGKIQEVTSFPDIKVKVVSSFPDLRVQKVSSFPDSCGRWQMVDSFPDLKVQFVTSFPDVEILYVESFPGLP